MSFPGAAAVAPDAAITDASSDASVEGSSDASVEGSDTSTGAAMPNAVGLAKTDDSALATTATKLGVASPQFAGSTATWAAVGSAIADEVPYPPLARPRPNGGISASADDELIARWNRGSGPAAPARAAHPAPRVRVDVLSTGSQIQRHELERMARARGYWPIRLCYEEALRQTQKLHATLRAQLSLPSAGPVRGAKVHQQGPDTGELATCIAKALRKLTLPGPPRGVGTASIEISLWPGDAPVPPRSPALDAVALPWPAGSLQETLRSNGQKVAACFTEGQRRVPGLWGRLALEFEVDAQGRVLRIAETESRFPDPAVTECVVRAFRQTSLPPSGRGARFVYAMRLSAAPATDGGP